MHSTTSLRSARAPTVQRTEGHLARLRFTSVWDTVLPLASSRRPRSTRWRKYSSYMMSSREASSGRCLIILRATCFTVIPSLETADQAFDALVVGLERILAEDRLALRVVQFQVDPVHAVVLPLEVGLADELAPEPRPRRLGRRVLRPLDHVVVGDAVHLIARDEPVVDAAVGADVVVLEVHQRNFWIAPRQAIVGHVGLDPLLLDDPVHLAVELHRVFLEPLDGVRPPRPDVLRDGIRLDGFHIARGVLEVFLRSE